MSLIRTPNLARIDDVYAALIAMHDGRDIDDSSRVNARLILALVNHIGDPDVVLEAIALAGRRRPSAAQKP